MEYLFNLCFSMYCKYMIKTSGEAFINSPYKAFASKLQTGVSPKSVSYCNNFRYKTGNSNDDTIYLIMTNDEYVSCRLADSAFKAKYISPSTQADVYPMLMKLYLCEELDLSEQLVVINKIHTAVTHACAEIIKSATTPSNSPIQFDKNKASTLVAETLTEIIREMMYIQKHLLHNEQTQPNVLLQTYLVQMSNIDKHTTSDKHRLQAFGKLLTRYYSNPLTLLADMSLTVDDDDISSIIQNYFKTCLTHEQLAHYLTTTDVDTTQRFIGEQHLYRTVDNDVSKLVEKTYNGIARHYANVHEVTEKEARMSSDKKSVKLDAAMSATGLGLAVLGTSVAP